jgi:hypothetical protein
MLCLMVDPKFKRLRFFFSLGHEEGVNIVEEHDGQSLYIFFEMLSLFTSNGRI